MEELRNKRAIRHTENKSQNGRRKHFQTVITINVHELTHQ